MKYEPVPVGEDDAVEGREGKRAKGGGGMTLEEYEAILDEDHTYDDVSLDI